MTSNTIPDTRGKTAFDWVAYGGRVEILKSMQNDPDHVDTLLVTKDGSQFPVNAVVVSVLGKAFTHKLYQQINNSNNPDVEVTVKGVKKSLRAVMVDKISSEAMSALIDSCYTGQLSMTSVSVWNVLDSAEYHNLRHIVLACCQFLSQYVNQENCLEMYVIAKKKESVCLLESSLTAIKKHFKSISDNKLFFSTIDVENLHEVLSSDHLNIDSEAIVWTSIKTWIHGDKKKRLKQMNKLINHIRYHRVSVDFWEKLLTEPLIIEAGIVYRIKDILGVVRNGQKLRKFKTDGNRLPVGRIPITICPRIPSSVLFAVGGWKTGQTCALVETYDYMTNQWFRSPSPEAGPKKAYHGIEILGNKMYVIGGTNGQEILDTVHEYDSLTNSWAEKKRLGTRRCYVATATCDGKIYAIGGHNGEFRMRSAEVYDPEKDEWKEIEQMIIARSDGAAAALNGRIYIAGGLNEGSIEASLEAYDPEKNEWTILQRMSSPRTSLAVAVYGGFLYAIGGNSGFERLASSERYDPETNTWTQIPDMIGRRSTFKAAVADRKIYVCGGYNGHHPIANCEAFDLETETWKVVSELSAARSGLAVVAIECLPNVKELTFHGNYKKN